MTSLLFTLKYYELTGAETGKVVSAELPAQRSSQTLVPVLLWLGLVGGMDLKTIPGVEQAGVLLVAPTSLPGRV